jgi:hypothetical protein
VGDDVVEVAQLAAPQVRDVALRPSSTAVPARSTPTAVIPGVETAIAMMFPPAPQPISSTRAVDGSGVLSPCSAPTVARRSGCVCAYGKFE